MNAKSLLIPLLLITTCLVTCTAATLSQTSTGARIKKGSRDRTRGARPATSAAARNTNPCTNDDHGAPIHCFCDGNAAPGNVTTADCWVFARELSRDAQYWASFSVQPRIQQMRIVVRPEGEFTYVPTVALRHLRDLRRLEIAFGSIARIHSRAFANLSQIVTLNLARNEVRILSASAFAHLPRLTELSLDKNHIYEIERDVFVDLPRLEKLYLADNNVSVVQDGAFLHLAHLLELELQGNRVAVITKDMFAGLSELKRLDLSGNCVGMLGDLTFAELWVLEELLLDANEIELISERAFVGLTHLRRLSLGHNRLTRLSVSAALMDALPAVVHLDLRANHLETLTHHNVRPILANLHNETSHFYIEDNPFVCDCRLYWLHKLRNETRSESIRDVIEHVTCHLPNNSSIANSGNSAGATLRPIYTPITSQVARNNRYATAGQRAVNDRLRPPLNAAFIAGTNAAHKNAATSGHASASNASPPAAQPNDANEIPTYDTANPPDDGRGIGIGTGTGSRSGRGHDEVVVADDDDDYYIDNNNYDYDDDQQQDATRQQQQRQQQQHSEVSETVPRKHDPSLRTFVTIPPVQLPCPTDQRWVSRASRPSPFDGPEMAEVNSRAGPTRLVASSSISLKIVMFLGAVSCTWREFT